MMQSGQTAKQEMDLQRKTIRLRAFSSRAPSKCSTSPAALAAMKKGLARSKTMSPNRNTSRMRIMRRMSSFGNEEVKLPEKSILSGKGSDRSLIRLLSERNLVRKISTSIHQSGRSLSPRRMSFDEGSLLSHKGSTASLSSTSLQSMHSVMEETKRKIEATPAVHSVALLHRKELMIGELLGQGAFSNVMAVDEIELMSQEAFQKKSRQLSESPQDDFPEENVLQSQRQQLVKAGTSLVVKHLNRKLLRKPKEFEQAALDLAQEAQILATVDCDYIIKLRAMSLGGTASLQSGRFDNFFLVLDRLEDTLDARIDTWKDDGISKGKAFFYRSTHYALELATALEYLHDRRIVYRDTKPQNVGFLSLGANKAESYQNERVQLFDFGLAHSLPSDEVADPQSDSTYRMDIAGTQRYMSPEMLDEAEYNCKTDVYSWALTFYEMLSLRKAYGEILRSRQFREYICGIGKRPYLGDLALPESLQQLLQDSWCGSQSDRLSMHQVRQRLEGILVELQE